ncbi:hypothetical protein LCX93_01375 [Sulfurimonas sp. SWIR-19]|uniref:hypothetical protein n=1 Tax=Sulfurimonas sp. SWIR-19 TaxID=2878390 RepID=UPI001CF38967|nr:hypothetical protein [Sulfurimonas sp. SWIR-19]UCN00594.1 hypothetical protein LCX93_01375 [Sulfurimonas sp. SWIR-19]
MPFKNQILFFLFTMTVIFLLAYDFFDKKNYRTHKKDILEVDAKPFEQFTKVFDTNRTFAYMWGIKEQVIQTKELNSTKEQESNTTNYTITKEKNRLCIDKNCYRFLGMYYKEGAKYVVFYGKTLPNNHIAAIGYKQTLQEPLYIKEIRHNHFTVAQNNTTKEWQFDIFDVNATKYKPKDTNETQY